jgi:CO dehydrogenase maturation factor
MKIVVDSAAMRIAFVGKGGSGKTTLSSLFARHLADLGLPVLAVDADINQQLGMTLGLDEADAAELPAMGEHLELLKDHLRGTNPRIASAAAMLKTTPPGRGSRFVRLDEENPVAARLERDVDGIRLMVTGPFSQDDLGVACYHGKTGAVELYLNHLLDGPGEYVVVDMTAGADSFASGLFTRFDLTVLVAEPTRKGVGVYRQYTEYARDFEVALRVVGNKVAGDDDLVFLREHVGADLLTWLSHSAFVRAMERGKHLPFSGLAAPDRAALEAIRRELDARPKDWARFSRQTVEFHRRNAAAWGNAQHGTDLTAQIDPDFVHPALAATEGTARVP